MQRKIGLTDGETVERTVEFRLSEMLDCRVVDSQGMAGHLSGVTDQALPALTVSLQSLRRILIKACYILTLPKEYHPFQQERMLPVHLVPPPLKPTVTGRED